MKKLTAVLVLLTLSVVAPVASADPTFTTGTVVVQGRPAKPSVVIEIQRARPGIGITTPTLAAVLSSGPRSGPQDLKKD
jgi:hypothetical protein